VLKRVKNRLRSTVGQDKLCDLSLFEADLTNNMDFECIVSEFTELKSRGTECGPMPNVMAALPNIGGALCSTPQSLVDAHYLTAVQ